MVVHLVSPNGRYDMTLPAQLRACSTSRTSWRASPASARCSCSAPATTRCASGSIRDKVAARGLTAGDVVRAIREQNVQVAAGVARRRRRPAAPTSSCPINAQGRLQTEEEFGDIIVKTGANGEIVRLRDVARIELGAADYSLRSLLDNERRGRIGDLPGAGLQRARDLRRRAREPWPSSSANFPAGRRTTASSTTPRSSCATRSRRWCTRCSRPSLLVVLVVILFLQTWRASIIPLLAVPVSIVGTFAVLYVLGFSINTLTLFGLVLAIGIVVDDAIVVVENVERNIERRPVAARGDAPGDARGVRPDHRDRAGAVRGVRADGLHRAA